MVTRPYGVFDGLVGQDAVIAELRQAAAAAAAILRGEQATGMTHAWLFTGPPGSGRSVAARAFAAALLCPSGGCGQCPACHQVFAGTRSVTTRHRDLIVVTRSSALGAHSSQTVRGAGSSIAFSSAFAACSVHRSASSNSTTSQRPPDGAPAARSTRSLVCRTP